VEARAIYDEVQKDNPGLQISATHWNSLCWYGSLLGNPQDVMDACEQAVRLDPKNSGIRDSRGLARALTNNITGAIEDFRFYIESKPPLERRNQREGWIKDLLQGKKPAEVFTDEEKKVLLDQ
jgi:hypothetical protein